MHQQQQQLKQGPAHSSSNLSLRIHGKATVMPRRTGKAEKEKEKAKEVIAPNAAVVGTALRIAQFLTEKERNGA